MGFEPIVRGPFATAPAVAPEPAGPPMPEPGWGDLFGASFEGGNMVGSFFANEQRADPNAVEEGFKWDEGVADHPRYQPYADQFAVLNNSTARAELMAKIDREEENRRIRDAAPWWQAAITDITAGVLDLPTLIPGGALVKGAKGGYSITRSALMGSAAAGVGASMQEAGLQATQSTRTAEESALTIGIGIALGGFIGGGAAALLSPLERRGAEAAAARLMDSAIDGTPLPDVPVPREGAPASAGAASVDMPTREDLTVAGGAARAVAQSTSRLTPNLRLNFSPAVSSRKIAQELAENPMFQNFHTEGKSVGPAAETAMDVSINSRMGIVIKQQNDIFREMKKAGRNMARGDFDELVGKALRTNDEDAGGNEYVTRAAKMWRANLIDPMKDEAVGVKILPEDVGPGQTAPSYLMRKPKVSLIEQEEVQFKAAHEDFYGGLLKDSYARSQKATAKRLDEIDQRIADMRLSPEDRMKAMADIEAQRTKLETTRTDLLASADRISELTGDAIKARRAGDKAAEKAARDEIKTIREAGGQDLSAFMKDRGALRSRAARVDLNYAGMADRTQTVLDQLAEIDARNMRSMERLIARGQKFERDLGKLNGSDLAERIARLRDEFAAVTKTSENAAERMKKAAAGLDDKDLVKRLDAENAREAKRFERLNAIAARLETLEGIDVDAMASELRLINERLAKEVSNVSLARGEKAQRLKDRLARLDPKMLDDEIKKLEGTKAAIERDFYDQWEVARGAQNVDIRSATNVDLSDYAKEIAQSIFDQYTGRAGMLSDIPDFLVPVTRGPMKKRTNIIPDALIERWLESNIMDVGWSYARKMGADTELTRKFGRADMQDQLLQIKNEYAELRAAVTSAPNLDEARRVVYDEPGRAADFREWMREKMGRDAQAEGKADLIEYLSAREKSDVADLQTMRDMLRGTDRPKNLGWDRVSRALAAFNYIRLMGGAVIANMQEIFRPAMVHGLTPYFREGIAPMLSKMGREARRASVAEAQLAGQVLEGVLKERLYTIAEMGDRLAPNSPMERLLQNSTKIASRWNGLDLWTDVMKGTASVMSQNRIINGVLGEGDARFLAYLGIDENMAGRIKAQAARFAEKREGIWIANTEKWDDPSGALKRAYRAAVSKDVDSIVVTKGVGDLPLLARDPTWRLILQFRGFFFAAHQRVLLRGLQEDKQRFIGGLVAMTSLGIIAAMFRAMRGGEDRWEKWKDARSNPGYLIGEGLDMSGIFALPMEVGNTVEKVTKFHPIKDPLKRAFPNASQQGSSVRYSSRGAAGALLGPTAGVIDLASEVATRAEAAMGGRTTAAQDEALIRKGAQMLPYYSYPGVRELTNYALDGTIPPF